MLDEEEEEASDGKEAVEGIVERNRRELTRLQAALLLIQAQLVQARAEEAGARVAKEWLSQQRSSDAQVRHILYIQSMLYSIFY